MNLNLKRIPEKDNINSKYLSNLYRQQNKKELLSYKGPLGSNRISYPILSVEDFERRFQFNNIVRSYNNLILNKRKNLNKSGGKNSDGLYLPLIKEIKIKKHGMNDDFNEFGYIQENSESKNAKDKSNRNNRNSSENNEMEIFNTNNDINERNLKSKYYGTNSTLSQSIILNKSNSNSKSSYDIFQEKKKILMRHLSHDSIFAAYKAMYILAQKDFKKKNKLAEYDYKDQLEKLKKEKMPKSKNEELFKEYVLKFNSEKLKEKLKDDFNFFQEEIENKVVNETDMRLNKLFRKLKKNEEKKNITNYFDKKHSHLKPSQRSIKTMLRKERKIDLLENKLIYIPKNEL